MFTLREWKEMMMHGNYLSRSWKGWI